PGDPDMIQDIVNRYQEVADAAASAEGVLKKDGSISQGRGSAMDALRKQIGDDLPDKLNKTQRSYGDAAAAYTLYQTSLSEAQDTFDKAVDQAQTASAAANQTPPTLGDNPTDQEKSDAKKAQDAIGQGKLQLSFAKALALQAKSMRETAQREVE